MNPVDAGLIILIIWGVILIYCFVKIGDECNSQSDMKKEE